MKEHGDHVVVVHTYTRPELSSAQYHTLYPACALMHCRNACTGLFLLILLPGVGQLYAQAECTWPAVDTVNRHGQ